MKIIVNEQALEVDATSDTPLLWVLRDHLGLTGTKFGCGMALCGACTVHLDGTPVRSCVLPLSATGGPDRDHHRGTVARTAAIRCSRPGSSIDVPQCGYCQSGQIMSAVGAAAAKPSAQRRRHRRRDVRQHLPLRHLPAHPRGHPPRR